MQKPSTISINIKLLHAKKLLNRLNSEIEEFKKENPYSTYPSENSKTGDWEIRLKINKKMPSDWSAQVGDIIHNLRSVLDLLIYQLFLSNKQSPHRDSGFPVCVKKSDFLNDGLKKIQGIDLKATETIKQLRPYKRGNKRLYQLHQLDITDKHKITIGVGGSHESVIIDFSEMFNNLGNFKTIIPSMPIGIRPADNQLPLKNGDALFAVKKGNNFEHFKNTKNNLNISFGDGRILNGEPMMPTLKEFMQLTEDIVNKLSPIINKTP